MYKTGPSGVRTAAVAVVAAILGAALVLLLLPVVFGVNPGDLVTGRLSSNAGPSVTRSGDGKAPGPTQGATDVSGVAARITPGVVNISTRTDAPANPFFPEANEGIGSGVIYTEDGYIITNNHVIAEASDIKVTLASGAELQASKVGADPENDIAVLKIDKRGLPALAVGDSDAISVGELVVAVGSPLGFEQTVTSGIVSALHRAVPVTGASGEVSFLTDLIQTDASINPGNSGGALCNANAALIGINTLIAATGQSRGSVGLGFAIPINTARKVADDLIEGRPVSHPYIGIQGQSVSERIARQYDLPTEQGAYVTLVVPGGPADNAKLRQGDIITAIEGKQIKSMDDVIAVVRRHKVGDKLEVTFYSERSKKTATVTVAEKPTTIER